MFYTPKYCGECGGEIEEAGWKFWTNNRFCENCKDDFKSQKWLPAIWVAAGLLGIIYGFGVSLKKPEKSLNPVTAANSAVTVKNKDLQSQSRSPSLTNDEVTSQKTAAIQTDPLISNSFTGRKDASVRQKLAENKQNQPTEAVYICGAQTKKGTACLRRVKGGGRCWQHLGQPAMLPPEKLLMSR